MPVSISTLGVGVDSFSSHKESISLPHTPSNPPSLVGSVTASGSGNNAYHELGPHTPSPFSDDLTESTNCFNSQKRCQVNMTGGRKNAFESNIHPSTISDLEKTYQHSSYTLVSPPHFSLEPDSQLPNQSIKAQNSVEGRYSPLSKTKRIPRYKNQYGKHVETMFKEFHENVNSVADISCPLDIMTVVMPLCSLDTPQRKTDISEYIENQHQIMITLRTQTSEYTNLCTPYKLKPEDYQFSEGMGYYMSRMLNSLGIKVDLGDLRFYTRVECDATASPQVVEVILYRKYLMLVDAHYHDTVESPQDPTLIRIIHLQKQRVCSYFDPSNSSRVGLSWGECDENTNLGFSSRAAASLFIDMLKHDDLEVPLIPPAFLHFCQKIEEYLLPLGKQFSQAISKQIQYTVLCVPYDYLQDPIALLNIWARIADMDDNEQVYLVVYSSKGIHFLSGFIGPDYETWSLIVSHKFMADMDQAVDLGHASTTGQCNKDILGCLTTFIIDEALKNRNSVKTPRTQMIIIANEPHILDTGVGRCLSRLNVDVFVIGIGSSHDPRSLSCFAESANGLYVYLDAADSLSTTLERFKKLTQAGSLDNISIQLRMRLNMKLRNISYGGSTLESDISSEDESSYCTLDMGKMYGNEVRTIIISVKGDIPPGEPLLRVSIDFTNSFAGAASRKRIEHNYEVRAPPLHSRSGMTTEKEVSSRLFSMVQIEYQFLRAFNKLKAILDCHTMKEDKKRISILSLRIYILSLKELNLGPEFNGFIIALSDICSNYHRICISQNFSGFNESCGFFRDLWALNFKHSLAANDSFGTMFEPWMRFLPCKT